MTPQPTAQPPINGHSSSSQVRLRQAILDRWGKPYALHGRFEAERCRLTIHTPEDRQIGELLLGITGSVGQITLLHIAGPRLRGIPGWLSRLVCRLAPVGPLAGHRGRGLGSLLVIYALKAACDFRLSTVLVPAPIPAPAHGLFRNLGFALEAGPVGTAAAYAITLSPLPRHDHP